MNVLLLLKNLTVTQMKVQLTIIQNSNSIGYIANAVSKERKETSVSFNNSLIAFCVC